MNYYEKYVKYKNKYCKIKLLLGGVNKSNFLVNILPQELRKKISDFADIIPLEIPNNIKEQIKKQIKEQINNNLFGNLLEDNIKEQIENNLFGYLLKNNIKEQIENKLKEQIKNKLKEQIENKLKENDFSKPFGIYYLFNKNNLIYYDVFYEGEIDDDIIFNDIIFNDIIFNDDILNSFSLKLERYDKVELSINEEEKLNDFLPLYKNSYYELEDNYNKYKDLVNDILLNSLKDQKQRLFIAFRCPFIIYYICIYTDKNNNNNLHQNIFNDKLFIYICIYLLYKIYKDLTYIHYIFKLNETLIKDKNFILKIIKLWPSIYYCLEGLQEDVDIVHEVCVNPDSINPNQTNYIYINDIFYKDHDKYKNLITFLEKKLEQNTNLITFLKEKLNQNTNTNTNLSIEINNQISKIENQNKKIKNHIEFLNNSYKRNKFWEEYPYRLFPPKI